MAMVSQGAVARTQVPGRRCLAVGEGAVKEGVGASKAPRSTERRRYVNGE
jgi:hypothetical protein